MDNPADIEQAYPDPFPPPSRYALPLFPTRVIYVLLVFNGLIFILDYLTQRYSFFDGGFSARFGYSLSISGGVW